MGLLDVFNSEQGRMGLGLLGGGFGQQVRQGVASMDDFRKQQMIAEIQKLQMQKAQAEMADAQEQKAKAQKMEALYAQFATPGQQAVPAIRGDVESGILPSQGMPGRPAGYDYQGLAGALAKINPMAALELQQKLVKQGPEFSPEVRYDQSGRGFIVAKDGSMKYLDGIKSRDRLVETDLGGKKGFRSEYSPELVGTLDKSVSPDTAYSGGVTMRGQNMTDARAKEANNIQQQSARTQIMQTPEGLIAIDKGRNQAVPVTMGGSPVRSEDAMKKTANAKTVLSLLDEAEKILPSSTGSAIGAGVDMAAGAAGMSTKGAQSIARLKSIEGQLIASMPRMEGPQSNADRMLYQQAAGDLANSMKPVKTRQAAAETLRKLQQKYVNPGSSDIQFLLDKYK